MTTLELPRQRRLGSSRSGILDVVVLIFTTMRSGGGGLCIGVAAEAVNHARRPRGLVLTDLAVVGGDLRVGRAGVVDSLLVGCTHGGGVP